MNNLIVKIIISVIICLTIGFVSGMSTTDAISNWYVNINKPSFNPPNWIFGPVWSILYTMMGVAAGLIWHEGLERKEVKFALGIFAVQIVLNALWSTLFFGMENPQLAFFEILLLLVMIIFTIVKFRQIKPIAGSLLIPYLLWVSFATILNFSIWQLN